MNGWWVNLNDRAMSCLVVIAQPLALVVGRMPVSSKQIGRSSCCHPHRSLPTHINHSGQAVDRANEWASALGLAGRVRFLLANATLFLDQILDSYPAPIDLITIQYPDPQFKRRHRKRRVVQPSLVDAAARRLAPGGHVLLQSDVLEVGDRGVAGWGVGWVSFQACTSPEYGTRQLSIEKQTACQ